MTALAAGCQVLVAPGFPPAADWAARLRLSAGTARAGDHAFPRSPWRAPGDEERALLVRDPSLPLRQDDLDASLALLTLPRHLLTTWWQLLERAADAGGPLEGFDGFLRELCDFLTFKGLGPAAGLAGEVVACAAGRSLSTDPATGGPAGLGWSAAQRLWGLVNLGNDPGELVFLNQHVGDAAAAAALIETTSDYPLAALRLAPGEGCRLPPGGLLVDAHTVDETVPGLWLLLRS